jgi:hypothetical protein
MQHPHIVDPCRLARSFRNSAGKAFDSQKIFLRMPLAQFAKKRAFTAAQINLQRRDTPEDGREIKASDVRLRDQLDHGEGLQPLRGESTSRRPN